MSSARAPLRSLVLTAALALVAGWGVAQLQVVVSIHPYYDLLRQIGGDRVEATRLLPPGASPHTFDPSPRDVLLVLDADLIVLNGVLDAWLEELIDASGTEAEVVELLPLLDLDPSIGGDHDHGDRHSDDDHEDGGGSEDLEHEPAEEGHDHGGINPHVWLDPLLMVDAVALFVERFVELDPDGAAGYAAAGSQLRDDLLALDAELRAMLAPAAGAPFVPFHDAWPHFAAHYGLDLVVEIEPFPGREPSPAYLVEALNLIADSGATAVFSERQLDPRPAEVVAESAGVALVLLDPIGGGDGTESYQEMLRYNARMIADALVPGADR